MKITITTTSFGEYDAAPIELCKKSGHLVTMNPHGRKVETEEFLELAKDAAGVIAGTEPITEAMMVKLPSLKVISRCGTGIDNVDLKAAERLGIKVFNTPDAPVEAVAELVICLILILLRKVSVMDQEVKRGSWKKRMGGLLCGKKVGIVGFGRIGSRVAELAGAFGAEVVYADPIVSKKEAGQFQKMELNELLRSSDIVSLNLSYPKDKRKVIGEGEIAIMKKGALLINCSRGGLVDEAALYLALESGKLAGAAMDVFEKEPYSGPLKGLENIILTPHIGSYAKEARVLMEMEAVKNLLSGLKKG